MKRRHDVGILALLLAALIQTHALAQNVRRAFTVATVAELYLARPADDDLYTTRGYSQEGVGGNTYRYDASAVFAVDYGYVLDGIGGNGSGTGTGRWIATNLNTLRASQYGVLPSGDSTVAFTRAVAAAMVQGKPLVVDMPVVSLATWTPVTTTSSITIVGDTTTPPMITGPGGAIDLLTLAAGHAANIDHVRFTGFRYLANQGGSDLISLRSSINVKDYGAKGDGTTEDTTAIQAAVDDIPPRGGTIHFPPGVYIVNNTAGIASVLFDSMSNFHIDAVGATIKAADAMPTNGTNIIVAFDECTDFTVTGLTIDGNRTPRTEFEGDTHNLYVRTCQRFRFCEVQSNNACSDGVILVTSDNTDTDTFCKDGSFVDCKFDNAYRDGVSVINGWDIHFQNCTFSNANGTAPKAGCNVEADAGSAMPANRSVTFQSCRFTDNEGYGLQTGPIDVYPVHVVVDGCYFHGNADGQAAIDNMCAIHNAASGLVVTNSEFDGAFDAIHSQVNDCRIENNTFRNVTDSRTDSPAIIYINATSDSAIIRGNRVMKSDFRRTFTADAGTDTITSASHGLQEHVSCVLIQNGTLPTNLAVATTYYLVNVTTNTFQLSATYGGSAINFTTNGTGSNEVQTSTLAVVAAAAGSVHNIIESNSIDDVYLAFNVSGSSIINDNVGSNLFYCIQAGTVDHIVTNNRFSAITQNEAVVLGSGTMRYSGNYLSSVRPKVHVLTGSIIYASDNEFASSSPSTWDAFEVEGTATIDGVTTTGYTSLAAIVTLDGGTATIRELRGAGSPEGVVSSSVGGRFLRTDGGAGTTLYIKESGASNTGWVGK